MRRQKYEEAKICGCKRCKEILSEYQADAKDSEDLWEEVRQIFNKHTALVSTRPSADYNPKIDHTDKLAVINELKLKYSIRKL